MAITDIFSKRQRRARGEDPDVFQYTYLPKEFRTQLVHILADLYTPSSGQSSDTEEAYRVVHDVLCREYGEFSLSADQDPRRGRAGSWQLTITAFLLNTTTERVLDLIEIAFRVSEELHKRVLWRGGAVVSRHAAATELNTRFREHGIGYQLEGGEIIKVDSQVLHAEVVKPALVLLADPRFAGANTEYMLAHQHYRHGRHAEAMNECLKAFESCLKLICKTRNWPYKETDTANVLLGIVFSHEIVPPWLQSEFAALRSTLESGVPTARNRVSGHGRGDQPRDVPDYFAAYLLHMTAAAIVFLVEASTTA